MGLEEFTDVELRLKQAASQLEREFEGIYDHDTCDRVVRESAEQLRGAAVASFVPILAHRFARERLRSQAQAEGKLEKSTVNVVFVSITGGGRARMAASLLQRRTSEAVNVHTAGSGEAVGIDENVRDAMEELGIDLSEKFTRPLTPEVLAAADVVVTMGRSVGIVEVPASARHVDWRVGDPLGAEIDEVRRVRDDIERRVTDLAAELEQLAVGAGAAAS